MEINEDLRLKLVKAAEIRGYGSPQQFLEDVLERELAKPGFGVSDQEITQKMEQLGYLDYGRDI